MSCYNTLEWECLELLSRTRSLKCQSLVGWNVNVSGVQIPEGSEILKCFTMYKEIGKLIIVLYIITFSSMESK
jgi:hypothetical protein